MQSKEKSKKRFMNKFRIKTLYFSVFWIQILFYKYFRQHKQGDKDISNCVFSLIQTTGIVLHENMITLPGHRIVLHQR